VSAYWELEEPKGPKGPKDDNSYVEQRSRHDQDKKRKEKHREGRKKEEKRGDASLHHEKTWKAAHQFAGEAFKKTSYLVPKHWPRQWSY